MFRKNILNTFPDNRLQILSKSADGKLSIVRVSSDVNPGKFYLYDRDKNRLRFLYDAMKHIKAEDLSPMMPIVLDARDGAKLHGYITFPKNKNKNLPLIVLPHGGPHGVRDYWGFNSEVQVLANAGYAVLQINYRGSDGYGLEFKRAGYKEWGGLIQRDIIDATKWAIKKNIADKNRICIMGASFGAYSAVQSAILEPELYQCVIANAGVYDLEMMYEEGDIPEVFYGEDYLERVVGKDKKKLKDFSPVYNLKKLKAEILIAHGVKDRRTPFDQAEALIDGLDDIGKKYEVFVKEKEGHGFYKDENQAEYLKRVIRFIDRNLH